MERRKPTSLGAHPPPPGDLGARSLPLVRAEGPWWRVHRAELGPIHFGRERLSRFDAARQEFGVLYMAASPAGAFVESVGWYTGARIMSAHKLRSRRLCQIWANGPLTLVDLTGPGLAVLGADARLCAGAHGVAQRWSSAMHRHPGRPDGVLYRARHDPSELCVALYERAGNRILAGDRGGLADEALSPLIDALLIRYEYLREPEDDEG